jgi:hypothetical protein
MAKRFQIDTGGTLNTGLVSFYQLDDLADFYGNNNLSQNHMTFVPGKIGNCVQLPGADDTAKLYTPSYITSNLTNVSVAGWIYVPTNNAGGGVFNIGTSGGWGLGIGGTGGLWENPGNQLSGLLGGKHWMPFNVNVGTGWHHIAMVRDTLLWKGYVDGIVCGTTYSYNDALAPSGNITFLGACNGNNTQFNLARRFYNARIDLLGVWNKPLIQQEITDLVYGGVGNTMIIPVSGVEFRKLM